MLRFYQGDRLQNSYTLQLASASSPSCSGGRSPALSCPRINARADPWRGNFAACPRLAKGTLLDAGTAAVLVLVKFDVVDLHRVPVAKVIQLSAQVTKIQWTPQGRTISRNTIVRC